MKYKIALLLFVCGCGHQDDLAKKQEWLKKNENQVLVLRVDPASHNRLTRVVVEGIITKDRLYTPIDSDGSNSMLVGDIWFVSMENTTYLYFERLVKN